MYNGNKKIYNINILITVSYTHLDVYKRQVVGNTQREELWAVVERFRAVFDESPGKAKDYICELKVRDHAPYMQRSYPVPFSKRRAVQEELDRMMQGDIIERSISCLLYTSRCV